TVKVEMYAYIFIYILSNGQYYPKIKSYPELKKGNLIDVLVAYKYSGETWYKIRIAGRYLGFVSGAYVEKV
ncbi:MAG: hypothetical protein Q4F24_17500, partial [Eubacteriales bacterium]|nr:hypothetical protein [Eubacteriales bacterium]